MNYREGDVLPLDDRQPVLDEVVRTFLARLAETPTEANLGVFITIVSRVEPGALPIVWSHSAGVPEAIAMSLVHTLIEIMAGFEVDTDKTTPDSVEDAEAHMEALADLLQELEDGLVSGFSP